MIPIRSTANLLRLMGIDKLRRELGMLVAFLAMGFAIWLSNSAFLKHDNIISYTRQIGMLGIMAVGITFVIVTGGIDLSLGSVMGLTGVIIAKFYDMGQPIWLGIIVAVVVALVVGAIQGAIITRLDLQPFIVTLGFMLLLRGVSQTIAHGGSLSLGDAPFRDLQNGPFSNTNPIVPWALLIFLLVVVVAGFVLHFTVFGRYLYAIGGNRAAAEYSGIPVKKLETITYVIAAGCSALAGICYAAYIGQMNHGVGIAYELFAIAAAVLGGVSLRGGEGTIFGVVIGTSIWALIRNGFDVAEFAIHNASGRIVRRLKLDENWYYIVAGAVILVAIILDQIVHLMQERRRTRSAGQTPPTSQIVQGGSHEPQKVESVK